MAAKLRCPLLAKFKCPPELGFEGLRRTLSEFRLCRRHARIDGSVLREARTLDAAPDDSTHDATRNAGRGSSGTDSLTDVPR